MDRVSTCGTQNDGHSTAFGRIRNSVAVYKALCRCPHLCIALNNTYQRGCEQRIQRSVASSITAQSVPLLEKHIRNPDNELLQCHATCCFKTTYGVSSVTTTLQAMGNSLPILHPDDRQRCHVSSSTENRNRCRQLVGNERYFNVAEAAFVDFQKEGHLCPLIPALRTQCMRAALIH